MGQLETDFFMMYDTLEDKLRSRYSTTVDYYFREMGLVVRSDALKFKTVQSIYTLVGQYASNMQWDESTYLKSGESRKEILHIIHTLVEAYEGIEFLVLHARELEYKTEALESIDIPDIGEL